MIGWQAAVPGLILLFSRFFVERLTFARQRSILRNRDPKMKRIFIQYSHYSADCFVFGVCGLAYCAVVSWCCTNTNVGFLIPGSSGSDFAHIIRTMDLPLSPAWHFPCDGHGYSMEAGYPLFFFCRFIYFFSNPHSWILVRSR